MCEDAGTQMAVGARQGWAQASQHVWEGGAEPLGAGMRRPAIRKCLKGSARGCARGPAPQDTLPRAAQCPLAVTNSVSPPG